ncbi:MAG: serine protease [Mucilaginibacter sp.]|nr:serine protease [Mucilaginibacter sp.]
MSEYLINSTVKLENVGDTLKNGQIISFESTGTAFYYLFKINNINVPVLVTNYHVIKNTALSRIVFSTADSTNKQQKEKLTEFNNFNFENKWIKHPKYDLAILPLFPIMEKIKKEDGLNIFFVPFIDKNIPTDSTINTLSSIETLLMIGYPKGYWDSKNNYPIVRRGTTATPLFSNFDNRNEFLLDIPIYSGSSGSPVVLLNEGSYASNNGLVAGSRLFLLGIATQSIDLKRSDSMNSLGIDNPLNIAIVIKASALADFKPILTEIVNQEQLFLKNHTTHK